MFSSQYKKCTRVSTCLTSIRPGLHGIVESAMITNYSRDRANPRGCTMRRTNPNTVPSAMLGVLGDAALAWLAAGRDFLGHTLEIGARHADGAIRSTMAPISGDASNRVDALADCYQRFLSDLGLAVPLAAQTFRRHLDDAKAPRLLFRNCASSLINVVGVSLKLSQTLVDGLPRIEAFPQKKDGSS